MNEPKDITSSVKPSVRSNSIENLYNGIMTISILNEKPIYREAHVAYVMNCQNGDGGFRGTPELVISTLGITYYVHSITKKLNTI